MDADGLRPTLVREPADVTLVLLPAGAPASPAREPTLGLVAAALEAGAVAGVLDAGPEMLGLPVEAVARGVAAGAVVDPGRRAAAAVVVEVLALVVAAVPAVLVLPTAPGPNLDGVCPWTSSATLAREEIRLLTRVCELEATDRGAGDGLVLFIVSLRFAAGSEAPVLPLTAEGRPAMLGLDDVVLAVAAVDKGLGAGLAAATLFGRALAAGLGVGSSTMRSTLSGRRNMPCPSSQSK